MSDRQASGFSQESGAEDPGDAGRTARPSPGVTVGGDIASSLQWRRDSLASVPDDELLRRLRALVTSTKRLEAVLVAHIAEFDARRLYLEQACSSMFGYCIERLGLSGAEAYLRITAARTARRHPVLLDMLADGRLQLTSIARLAPHLTSGNCDGLLARAAHLTRRETEELVAALAPRPDVVPSIRRVRTSSTERAIPNEQLSLERVGRASSADGVASVDLPATVAATDAAEAESVARVGAPAATGCPAGTAQNWTGSSALRTVGLVPVSARHRAGTIEPLSPGRYKVQFTASSGLRDKLERLRLLLASTVPDGDLATVLDMAVTELLRRVEARRLGAERNDELPRRAGIVRARGNPAAVANPGATVAAAVASPEAPSAGPPAAGSQSPAARRPARTSVPVSIRRLVWNRDGGQCRYVDALGHRCQERRWLEFHHRHPVGYGGSHDVDNVALMCRAHNAHLGEVDYGRVEYGRTNLGRAWARAGSSVQKAGR